MGQYMPEEPKPIAMPSASQSLQVQLLGDISLDNLYCNPQSHNALSQNMRQIAHVLGACDIRVANWESPLWGDGCVNSLKCPRLATTRAAAEAIAPLNLDVAILANNHAFDCREAGFQATTDFLDSHGIAWIGAGQTPQAAARPLILERKPLSLGLLAYVGSETNPNVPSDARVFLNELIPSRVLADVAQLRARVDHVLVFLHWGAEEGVRYPSVEQRRIGRALADAGATLVIGSHAHHLQGDEQRNSGHIFYSLGNFLFSPRGGDEGKIGDLRDRKWRSVGVPCCTLGASGVQSVQWSFFRQCDNELLLRPDNTSRRHRAQNRLSVALRMSDACLGMRYRIDCRLAAFAYYVYRCGGVLPAMLSLRQKQFRTAWSVLRGQATSEGTKRTDASRRSAA